MFIRELSDSSRTFVFWTPSSIPRPIHTYMYMINAALKISLKVFEDRTDPKPHPPGIDPSVFALFSPWIIFLCHISNLIYEEFSTSTCGYLIIKTTPRYTIAMFLFWTDFENTTSDMVLIGTYQRIATLIGRGRGGGQKQILLLNLNIMIEFATPTSWTRLK